MRSAAPAARHAVEFARELGCSQVVVPLGDLASTWSALGVMASDVLHVHEYSELVQPRSRPASSTRSTPTWRSEARDAARERGLPGDQIEITPLRAT